jgi:D-glycero-D-manno-heptose 1,7-bisphosphate phosphatase
LVGDKKSDIACGKNAGVRTILVRTGYGAQQDNSGADWIASDLTEAVKIILNPERNE